MRVFPRPVVFVSGDDDAINYDVIALFSLYGERLAEEYSGFAISTAKWHESERNTKFTQLAK